MSRGQNPLVLMMALSLPGAAHALGLGEIHVNSALNEPLAADIEILGATAEELSSIRASVANKDTFLRFGAERPAFLASATFKVSQDAKGRPVLVIRSSESFTEPVVNLLVDLRWHNGEVIRQYSLLLDPSGFPAATQMAAAVRSPVMPLTAPVVTAPVVTMPVVTMPASAMTAPAIAPATIAADTLAAAAPVSTTRTTTHVKIGAKATLRGVAWRVGARSDSDIKKTMLAIFRANPHAFDGNINRLHLGVVLTIPPAEEIATLSKEDAGREIRSQMAAWRASPQKARARAAAVPVPATSSPVQAPVQGTAAPAIATASPAGPLAATASTAGADAPRAAAPPASDAAEEAALRARIQSLELGLDDVQGRLKRENDKLLDVQAQITYAENAADTPVESAPSSRPWLLPSLIAGMALLAGALGAIFLSPRRRPKPRISPFSTVATRAPAVMVEASKPVTKQVPVYAQKPAIEPASRETRTDMPRPVWEDLNDSISTHTVATDSQPVFTIDEEELRAAYEDTVDLGETAVLAADFPMASGETANLPAATVNLNAEALQALTSGEETATAQVSNEALHVNATKLDYNLVDLDQTAQHVHMPSELNERTIVKERRTNLVDVLKMAVEREPDRGDLRMKLLETYYAAAAANRQGFLELVQKLAHDRDRLEKGEWDKIAYMGKQIASDSALFSAAQRVHADSQADDDDLANCA
jgi:pilus assembly protein FimV